MAAKPIIFAMANPDPEITPEDVRSVRADAIIATGRSDYANQINNVLGFPYIFRGALDVRASTINDDMKIAAPEDLMSAVKASEHQVILAAIHATDNRVEAAKKLGISPRTLRYKMAKLKTVIPDLALAF